MFIGITCFFLPGNQQKVSPRKLILILNHNFLLVKYFYKQKSGQMSIRFASSFQKFNWIVKLLFWCSIDKGLFVIESCPGQKVRRKKTKTKIVTTKSP